MRRGERDSTAMCPRSVNVLNFSQLVNKSVTQHQGACSRGGGGGYGCCVQARDKVCDPAPGSVFKGVSPPGMAAVFKHETGTVTKQQITGALQFKVAFTLRGGGGGNSSGNIYHFVVTWEAGGPSPLKPARLSRTPQNTIHS